MAELVLLKQEIGQFVSFKDQGEITHLLSIEIIRNRSARTISFSHCHYIDTMLTTYRLDNARPVSMPAATGVHLSRGARDSPSTPDEVEYMRRVPYQNAVGALNHCAIMTCPDISLAIQKVSQFTANPGVAHWTAVKRILCYLKGMRDFVLTLGGYIDLSTAVPLRHIVTPTMQIPQTMDVLSQAMPSSLDLALFPGQQRNKWQPPGLLPKLNTMQASMQDKRSRGCASYSPRLVFLCPNPPHSISTTRPRST